MKPIRYKTKRWFNIKRRSFCWGIIGLINGEWANITESDTATFYTDRGKAIKRVKQLNKEVSNG